VLAVQRDVKRIGPIGALLVIVAGLGLWLHVATTQRPSWAPDWSGWVVTALAWLVMLLGAWALFVCLRLRERQELPDSAPRQMTDTERAELSAFQQAGEQARKVEEMVALGRAGNRQMDAMSLSTAQRDLTQTCETLAADYPEWRDYLLVAINRPLDDPEGLLSTLGLIVSILNPEIARRDPAELIQWGETNLSRQASQQPGDFIRDSLIWHRHAQVWLKRNRQGLFDEMRRKTKGLPDDDLARSAELIRRTLPYLKKALPKS
jgi:hypothetical protein